MKHHLLSLGSIFALFFLHGCKSTEKAAEIITIGDCDDLKDAVSNTRTTAVDGELTTTYVDCPEWTSFEITGNRLKLIAGGAFTDEDQFTFYNVRFIVSSQLRVNLPVQFTGDEPVNQISHQVNGGIFYIEEGARADFLSDVSVHGGVVDTGVRDSADVTADAGRGGCFYNEGRLKFHGSLETNGCRTSWRLYSTNASVAGDGGTIWNGENARLTVKGTLDLECTTVFHNEGDSRGDAIYNAGKIDIYEDASFTGGCYAGIGGAIYNEGRIRFHEESFVIFGQAYAPGNGGHIFNSGKIYLLGGADHQLGNAGQSGGGIYNEGKAIYSPSTSVGFYNCGANDFGGAIALMVDSTFDLPADVVFDENYILFPEDDDVDQCDDIYLQTETGYTCLTSWPQE